MLQCSHECVSVEWLDKHSGDSELTRDRFRRQGPARQGVRGRRHNGCVRRRCGNAGKRLSSGSKRRADIDQYRIAGRQNIRERPRSTSLHVIIARQLEPFSKQRAKGAIWLKHRDHRPALGSPWLQGFRFRMTHLARPAQEIPRRIMVLV
jgi:hypothetical protein